MIRSRLLQVAPPTAGAPPFPNAASAAVTGAGRAELGFLRALLDEQRDLSAVEHFAHACSTGRMPDGERSYRHLLPASPPGPGQQYAFEVDLDACSGCKSCVAACHSLNGLDDGESWRTTGLLVGGSSAAPVQQTVTTSCHHCVDPACLRGCPVKAYDKDPVTGIVAHLDDQCIGCGYCTFMCPYDAPRYSARLGIVRKCDMCSQRLAAGEAPACVQACPTGAIRIHAVDVAQVIEDSQAARLVPGTVPAVDTVPTTRYTTRRAMPANLRPADYYAMRVEDAHPALVLMLVLTQLSVGTYVVATAFSFIAGTAVGFGVGGALTALCIALGALAVSVFHLGRPHLAFRALLGLRTSWLSREIAAFSAFAGLAILHAASYRLAALEPWRAHLEAVCAAAGLAAIACSVMVYAATQRPCWSAAVTGCRFYGSSTILGSALFLLVAAVDRAAFPRGAVALLLFAALAKLALELALLRRVRDRGLSPLRQTATLLLTELHPQATIRFACAAIGGVMIPLGLLLGAPAPAADIPATGVGSVALFSCCLIGELFERHLFFAATPRPRMPGGFA